MVQHWVKLIELEDEAIWRGAVFRSPSVWPYEDTVDFMVIEDAHSPTHLSLIVSSGYKAGCRKIDFPMESAPWKERRAISKAWVVESWQEQIYQDSDVAQVLFLSNYPAPVLATVNTEIWKN
jgi:Immunity protein 45